MHSSIFAGRLLITIPALLAFFLLSLSATAQDTSRTTTISVPAGERVVIVSDMPTVIVVTSDLDARPDPSSYWAVGGTLVTPAGLNLVVAHYSRSLGVRLAAGYWGSIGGAQIDLAYEMGRRRNFSHHLYLGVGASSVEVEEMVSAGRYYNVATSTKTWQYVGLGYDVNWNGFFVSSGLNIGSGDFSSPQLMAQIGYVYEIR